MIDEQALPNEAATIELGNLIARARPDNAAGCLITLSGELGAGKTTLVRSFLQCLGHRGPVPSPTYTLVESYELLDVPIHHVDLYRIADSAELEFLGWSDLRAGLVIVEWPERVPGLEDSAAMAIRLHYADHGRLVTVRSGDERGERWLQRMTVGTASTE